VKVDFPAGRINNGEYAPDDGRGAESESPKVGQNAPQRGEGRP
jgi:hypothetical protein